MPVRYVTGDIFGGPERVIVHGCNAFGMMGAGIAKQIKTRYPQAYRVHRDAFEALADRAAGLPLGSTTWARGKDGRLICNAVTQHDYGHEPGRVYVDYNAVRQAFRSIDERAREERFSSIALPLIGAGLAGGFWKRISAIVEDEAKAFEPVVYLFDGKLPES